MTIGGAVLEVGVRSEYFFAPLRDDLACLNVNQFAHLLEASMIPA